MKSLSPISPLTGDRHLLSDRYFFNSSKLFAAQITDLFDFIWPTLTAMWNLRWQVSGYLNTRKEAITKEELVAKFINQEHKHVRPNLYRSCIEFSWDRQTEDLSKTILINLFAYYESWVENILSELRLNTKTNQKKMQFPSTNASDGILSIHSAATTPASTTLTNSFYNVYKRSKKYSFPKINNLLITYRYFKECRNSLVHLGGRVDQKLCDASIAYDALSTTDIAMTVKPEYSVFAINDKVTLNIKGIAGLTDILLRIVTSIDAEFLQGKAAEDVFLNRIKSTVGPKPKNIDFFKKEKEIRSIVQRSAFAKPNALDGIETFFKLKGILK
jgi:hypothetical protein